MAKAAEKAAVEDDAVPAKPAPPPVEVARSIGTNEPIEASLCIATMTMPAVAVVTAFAIAAAVEGTAVEKPVAPAATAAGLPTTPSAAAVSPVMATEADETAVEEAVSTATDSTAGDGEGGTHGGYRIDCYLEVGGDHFSSGGACKCSGGRDIAQTRSAAALSVPESASEVGRRGKIGDIKQPVLAGRERAKAALNITKLASRRSFSERNVVKGG